MVWFFGKSGSTLGITTRLKFGFRPSRRFPLGKSKKGLGGGNSRLSAVVGWAGSKFLS